MKCTVNVIVYLRRSLTTPPQHNVNVNIIRMMMMGCSIIIMCNNIIIEIITITSSFTFFWCYHCHFQKWLMIGKTSGCMDQFFVLY